MKLDEFLNNPSFSSYKPEITVEIHDAFINEGCEKFLWTTFPEQEKADKYTKKLIKKKGEVRNNPFIEDFMNQFGLVDDYCITFIYPEDYSPKYLMAQEIAKKAVSSYIIKNIFPEDDTVNWIAIFEPCDISSIEMMFCLMYSTYRQSEAYGGYKLFRQNINYYADNLQYDEQQLFEFNLVSIKNLNGMQFRIDTNPIRILESRKNIAKIIKARYFKDEYEIYYYFMYTVFPYLHKMYLKADLLIKTFGSFELGQINLKKLNSKMIADGTIVSKWKSEQTLFTLVKKHYPDALFQYRHKWLEPQNLDIFIPSLNVGIEYQGIQHYQSVDFFGGEEALIKRQELDARKKKLCAENSLILLEWSYQDDISVSNLKRKLSALLNSG